MATPSQPTPDPKTETEAKPAEPRWADFEEDEKNGKEVVVDRCDETSPLFSAKNFEDIGLSPELLKGVYELGFKKPSRIQEKALPLLLSNPPQNLIAQAQSGSGKTAAFALCMLSRVDPKKRQPQALCLCPARELALQIEDVVKKLGKFTQIQTICCVPNVEIPPRLEQQIVIGTPGKILNLIGRSIDPRGIRLIVLDEADMMLDAQGLREQSTRIYKALNSKDCQYALFSATYRDDVAEFAEKVVPQPRNSIRLKEVKEVVWQKIRQYYIDCSSPGDRLYILQQIYGAVEFSQTIIFVNTRATAADLARQMTGDGFQVGVLYGGDMPSEQRDQVIEQFRSGRAKVLITTNVLARGIDVPTVELVINYDIPLVPPQQQQHRGPPQVDVETYIHRIGRAGRFDRPGVAVNLVFPAADSLNLIPSLENIIGRNITPWPADKILELAEKMKELATKSEFH